MNGDAETSEAPSLSSILVDQDQDVAGSFRKDTFKTTSMSEWDPLAPKKAMILKKTHGGLWLEPRGKSIYLFLLAC